jgi:hypothetical protein
LDSKCLGGQWGECIWVRTQGGREGHERTSSVYLVLTLWVKEQVSTAASASSCSGCRWKFIGIISCHDFREEEIWESCWRMNGRMTDRRLGSCLVTWSWKTYF